MLYCENLWVDCTQNHSEPYWDKEIPLRRALIRGVSETPTPIALTLQSLLFWISWSFLWRRFPCFFCGVFAFLSSDFEGSAERKNPCIFGGFLAFLPRKEGLEGQVISEKVLQYNSNLCGSTPPICVAVPSWLLSLEDRGTQHYTSNLYCSTPPICMAVRPHIT